MFKLTTKSTYAVAAVIDLARHYESGLVQLRDVSKRNNIPAPYLIQIFNRLTKAGIVKAQRGKTGGYTLARKPAEITLLHTLEALEGRMELAQVYKKDFAVADIFCSAEKSLRSVLSVSLAEIVSRSNQRNGALFFDI
jgi:Rrf2 family iron-sulfur cluster assembly transcriptional regulator